MPRLATTYAEFRPRLSAAQRGRELLRSAALTALGTVGVGDALRRPRVHVLNLHHVFPDEERPFRELLDALRRTHEFLGYSEAVRRIHAGPIDRPYLAVTFDDGLRTCLAAARVMSDLGVSACFFVCPPVIGLRDEARAAAFCRDRIGVTPAEFLGWGEVEELLRLGHEVGGHTTTHANVRRLGPAELDDEIAGCRAALVARLGRAAGTHFAWPFGRFAHFSAAGARAVFDAGFGSCASGERGAHVVPSGPDPRRLCVRREHVIAAWPVAHTRAFLARGSRRASAADNAWPAEWTATL